MLQYQPFPGMKQNKNSSNFLTNCCCSRHISKEQILMKKSVNFDNFVESFKRPGVNFIKLFSFVADDEA